MGWRDRLRPASWRGVVFEVDATSGDFGRRGVVHEFPQRDLPHTEDLGRAARVIRMQAFVVGADYDARRDALIAAIERGGSGVLVHPFLGRLTCSIVKTLPVTESKEEGGVARFDLEFIESGEISFPRVTIDAAAQVPGLAAAAAAAATVAAGEASSAGARALRDTPAVLASSFAATPYISTVNAIERALGVAPNSLLEVLLKEDFDGLEYTSIWGFFETLTDLWRMVAIGRIPTETVATGSTEYDARAQGYFAAWVSRLRIHALARASVIAAATEFDSWDAVQAVREVIVGLLAGEEEAAAATLYDALVDLRINVSLGLGDLAERLPREQRLALPGLASALAIAYDLYEDPLRDAEIVHRNSVRHPDLVSGTITVLSR